MGSMLSVSIVIPTWNESRRILSCLRNATTQTMPAHEIIVVDNRSTDNTHALVEQFIAELGRDSECLFRSASWH